MNSLLHPTKVERLQMGQNYSSHYRKLQCEPEHEKHIKKAMVPMATFMKESRSSVLASQQGRCVGLRISQRHKLCWSRASVSLAGTTGQLSLSIIFPGPTSNPCLPPAPADLQWGVFVVVVSSTTTVCHVGSYSHFKGKFCPGVSQHHTFQPGAVHSENGFET